MGIYHSASTRRRNGGLDGRGGKAGLSQAGRRFPAGAKLHKRGAEASGFDGNARLGRIGHFKRVFGWWNQFDLTRRR
jgi:hypothetical protein